jgi:hypothetical protein
LKRKFSIAANQYAKSRTRSADNYGRPGVPQNGDAGRSKTPMAVAPHAADALTMNAAPLSEARQAVAVCEREGPTVAAYDRSLPRSRPVVCLSCGHGYPKPVNQGSYLDNPGCPVCDYGGWAGSDFA